MARLPKPLRDDYPAVAARGARGYVVDQAGTRKNWNYHGQPSLSERYAVVTNCTYKETVSKCFAKRRDATRWLRLWRLMNGLNEDGTDANSKPSINEVYVFSKDEWKKL